MRKILCLLLTLTLMIPVISIAEQKPELTGLSDENLLLLEAEIIREKQIRGLPASAILTPGTYNIGVEGDIPPGRYIIKLEYSNTESSSKDWNYIDIHIRDLDRKLIDFPRLTTQKLEHPSYSIQLQEGMSLSFQDDAAIRLIPSNSVIFE